MMRKFALFTSVALLAGCATTAPVPLPATHPASPSAPEGARLLRQSALGADETTRKSQALLSAAQKEQEKWDAYGPVSGTPEEASKSDAKAGGKHDNH